MDELNPTSPIEGFLFTFGINKYGFPYCHIIFCVLKGRHFSQFKQKGEESPIRSGILDANIRLEDSGRKIVNGLTLYTLRIYSVVDTSKERFMGAVRSEETAAWIRAFQLALLLPIASPEEGETSESFGDTTGFPFSGDDSPRPLPLHLSPKLGRSSFQQLTTIGAVEPPPALNCASGGKAYNQGDSESTAARWRLVRCSNGLRFFEEIKGDVIKYTFYKLPVMKCVGVVKAEPSAVFDLVMQYGPERLQWDTTIDSADVIETKDGHSDVVHVRLRQDWIWLRKRDLCLSRYWIREEDGSYLVFFKSVEHPNCPRERSSVRATVHSGGYIISPLKSSSSGKPKSLVEHVLEMDVSGWSSWFGTGISPYPAFVRDSLLRNIAGIRDHFAAQRASGNIQVVQWKLVEVGGNESLGLSTNQRATPGSLLKTKVSFLDTEDVDEEFFDAFSDAEVDYSDLSSVVVESPRDLLTGDPPRASSLSSPVDWSLFPGTVMMGPLLGGTDCWSRPDGAFVRLRGKTFFQDEAWVPAGAPLCRLVAVDWLQAEKRTDHLAARPGNIVQKVCRYYGDSAPFIFVINMQVPGTRHFNLVYYFELDGESREGTLLRSFLEGDDVFRNGRINLVPSIAEGNWIVKQAAGSRPVPIGQAMEVQYFSGEKYLEIDVNMGSSSIVRGVMGLVFGYITNLVVDMAFVIKAENSEELPEAFLGVVRCSHLSLESAAPPTPEV